MRVNNQSGSGEDLLADDTALPERLPSTLDQPSDESWISDQVEQRTGGEEYLAGGDANEGFAENFPEGATIRPEDLRASVVYDSARRALDSGDLRERLSFLAGRTETAAPLADLKRLADQLGFGGVIGRGFDDVHGSALQSALQKFEGLAANHPAADTLRALLPSLAGSRDLKDAIGKAGQLAQQLGNLAQFARGQGAGEVGDGFARLARGAQYIADWANTARSLESQTPQKFAANLGKELGEIRTLQGAQQLAEKYGLGNLVNQTLGSDIGKSLATLGQLAQHLPNAQVGINDVLQQLKNLGNSNQLGDIAKHLGDIPGGLSKLADLAHSLGHADLGGALEAGLGKLKELGNFADGLKGKSAGDVVDGLVGKLKDVSPETVADLVMSQLPGKKTYQGSFAAHGSVVHEEGSFGSPGGVAYGRGSVELLSAGATGSGRAEVDLKNGRVRLDGTLDANALLARAEGEAHLRAGPLEANAQGSAEVGARAHVQGHGEFDLKEGTAEISGQGKLFAGARADVSGDASIGGVGVSGQAGLRVGLGVEAGGHIGFDHGKFSVGFNIGATLGIGFNLGFSVSIDFKKIGESLSNIWHNIGDGVEGVFHAASEVGHAVGAVVSDVGHAVGGAVSAVGSAVGGAVSAIGHGIAKVFSW